MVTLKVERPGSLPIFDGTRVVNDRKYPKSSIAGLMVCGMGLWDVKNILNGAECGYPGGAARPLSEFVPHVNGGLNRAAYRFGRHLNVSVIGNFQSRRFQTDWCAR